MATYTKAPGGTLDVYLMGFRPGDGLVVNSPDTDCEWECVEGGVSEDCTIPVTGCGNPFESCITDVQPIQCIPEVEACSDPCKTCGGDAGLTAEEVTVIATEVAMSPEVLQCTVDAVAAAAASKA